MSINLTWPGFNSTLATSILVYRSEQDIDPEMLPDPIATLAGTEISYTDTAVTPGVVYHYRVAMVGPTDTLLSDQITHGYFPDNGPGPQTILRGDWKRGYFGTVTSAEFLTASEARALCDFNSGTLTADDALTHWHKFIYDGKILFIPHVALCGRITPLDIYNAGLMYGTDDGGSFPDGLSYSPSGLVNQRKVVNAKGKDFLVRLPKLSTLPTSQFVGSNSIEPGSEFYETYCKVFLSSDLEGMLGDWENNGYIGGIGQHMENASRYWIIYGNTTTTFPSGNNGPTRTTFTSGASGSNWTRVRWHPVFELIYPGT